MTAKSSWKKGDCDYTQCYVPASRHNSCAAKGLGPACWGDLGHQHTPKRSHGGKACHVKLCEGHADMIDNGMKTGGIRLGDRIDFLIVIGEDSREVYVIYDRDAGVLREIPL